MMHVWRTMDTAPKVQGKMILAVVTHYYLNEPHTRVVHWDPMERKWQDSAGGGDEPSFYSDEALSGWMPLPSPETCRTSPNK